MFLTRALAWTRAHSGESTSIVPCAPAAIARVRASVHAAWATAGAAAVVAAGLPSFVALILGALIALALGPSELASRAGKRLLQWGVVGLGAGLDLGYVVQVGSEGLLTTAVTLAVTLGLGALLGRRLEVATDVTALVTVGTAICGGSAIAAAAPTLRATSEDVGTALAVVFALNALALLLFPPLGHALGLDPLTYGRWCALAVHDTSSVVGAASAFGTDALEIATVTKLARALWIVPVVLVLGYVRGRERRQRARDDAPARGPLPLFILAFVGLAAVVTYVPALAPAGETVAGGARRVLCLALFALGLGVDVQKLRRGLGRAMLLGSLLFGATSIGSLLIVVSQ